MTTELDNLLDATLDDLEDLPEFKPFAAGAHRVTAKFESKEINGKPAIELTFTMIETMELADAQAEAPKAGDTSNTMFFLDNEYGRGNLKKCSAPFAEALGLTSIRDIVEQVQEVECVIISSIQIDKKDSDKKYLKVSEIQVL